MATFYNQATLSYGGNVVSSNTTEAELLSGLALTKTAISDIYTAGGNVVYAITLTNMGGTEYNGLTVTDNLGEYDLVGGGTAVPLDYVDGTLLYYLNGVLQPTPTVTAGDDLVISGIDLPANGTATFIYEVRVNELAPVAAGSTITNTASVGGCAGVGVITADATIGIRATAQLTIAKAVSPAVITDNGRLTYTLIVQNLGNTPLVATDGVIIADVFNPILTDLDVTLDGVDLAPGTGYTYDMATGEFSTTDGVVTVPAATYTQDPLTGVVTTVPGVTVLTITGTI